MASGDLEMETEAVARKSSRGSRTSTAVWSVLTLMVMLSPGAASCWAGR